MPPRLGDQCSWLGRALCATPAKKTVQRAAAYHPTAGESGVGSTLALSRVTLPGRVSALRCRRNVGGSRAKGERSGVWTTRRRRPPCHGGACGHQSSVTVPDQLSEESLMKRLLLLGTAMSLAMVAGASAADLAPMYMKAPPPPPVSSWTGCYVGGNVGGGWSHVSNSEVG